MGVTDLSVTVGPSGCPPSFQHQSPLRSRSTKKEKDDEAQCEEFVDVVEDISNIKSRFLGPLKTVARFWGEHFVQYYELASKGAKY